MSARTKEELLAEIKKLRTRVKQLEKDLQVVRKNRNNQQQEYEENHMRWSQERNGERAKAEEILQAERTERHRTEEELGQTKVQLKDVSFKLLLAEETERKRIAQEALNNIIKHSKAKVVNLGLEIKVSKIEFVIQDNGQGFDLDAKLGQKHPDSGLGLAGMIERAKLSGGVLLIKSAKESGTTIRASWPFSSSP
jgi:signal transduction histidine kinase